MLRSIEGALAWVRVAGRAVEAEQASTRRCTEALRPSRMKPLTLCRFVQEYPSRYNVRFLCWYIPICESHAGSVAYIGVKE